MAGESSTLRTRLNIEPTHVHEMDGRLLFVVDNVLPPPTIARFHELYARADYQRVESDRATHTHIRTASMDIDIDLFQKSLLYLQMASLVDRLFPRQERAPYRAYCNMIVYGDMVFAHRDCEPDMDDITVLYYANATWQRDWGGETLFFASQGDIATAVSPRPGRFALFHGAIEHRVGVPARECYEPRLTVACKWMRN